MGLKLRSSTTCASSQATFSSCLDIRTEKASEFDDFEDFSSEFLVVDEQEEESEKKDDSGLRILCLDDEAVG